jgi:hypothetical protein
MRPWLWRRWRRRLNATASTPVQPAPVDGCSAVRERPRPPGPSGTVGVLGGGVTTGALPTCWPEFPLSLRSMQQMNEATGGVTPKPNVIW